MDKLYRHSTKDRLYQSILTKLYMIDIDQKIVEDINKILNLNSSLHHTYAEMVTDYAEYKEKLLDLEKGVSFELPEDIPYNVPNDIIEDIDDIFSRSSDKGNSMAQKQDIEYGKALLIDRHNEYIRQNPPDLSAYEYIEPSINNLIDNIREYIPDFKGNNPQYVKNMLTERNVENMLMDRNVNQKNSQQTHKENLFLLYEYEVNKNQRSEVSTLSKIEAVSPSVAETPIIHQSVDYSNIDEKEYTDKIRELLLPTKFGPRLNTLILNEELKKRKENISQMTFNEKLVKLYEHLKSEKT